MTTVRFIATALVLAVAAGCGSVVGGDDVEVRVSNLSAVAFDSVTVTFPSETHRYGRVDAGASSGYAQVSQAYRYARIEVWAAGASYVLQPIDYVGEQPLAPGRHTYGLTLNGDPPALGIVMADAMGPTSPSQPSAAQR
ncbi:MAG TPA: hypothetical protein VK928_03800 [Longimicrobiales bacterium]|nr:hypothetical protein [Longimicrobiales bacterium]